MQNFVLPVGEKVVNGINELNITTKITEKTLFKYDDEIIEIKKESNREDHKDIKVKKETKNKLKKIEILNKNNEKLKIDNKDLNKSKNTFIIEKKMRGIDFYMIFLHFLFAILIIDTIIIDNFFLRFIIGYEPNIIFIIKLLLWGFIPILIGINKASKIDKNMEDFISKNKGWKNNIPFYNIYISVITLFIFVDSFGYIFIYGADKALVFILTIFFPYFILLHKTLKKKGKI